MVRIQDNGAGIFSGSTCDIVDRLDELESHLADQQQHLADNERALKRVRERLDDDETPAGAGIGTGGLLSALGLVAVSGMGSADPQGRLGTGTNPVDTVYTAALDGSVTDDQQIDSLLGDGLRVESEALTRRGGD